MKRKNYKVKIKLVFETTMNHSQTSMEKAKEDVNRVLTNYLKDKKLNIVSTLHGKDMFDYDPTIFNLYYDYDLLKKDY